jgi:hypothetical protein
VAEPAKPKVVDPLNLAKLEEIQACLRQEKNLGNNVQANIYSHLMEVITRIVKYHPYDGLDRFEEVSTTIKQTNLQIANAKKDSELNGSVTVKQALQWIE